MNSVFDSIKKNSDLFSFISTFFDLVGNKEFKAAEIDAMYTQANSKETSIWRALSAVAEDLGLTFYDNVINFIDNVGNIDTCKTKTLQSMMSMLGFNYNVFNDIKTMPLDVQNLIDILSIKREYLIKSDKIDKSLVDVVLSGGKFDDQGTGLFYNMVLQYPDISATSEAIDALNHERRIQVLEDSSLSNFWGNYQLSSEPVVNDEYYRDFVKAVFNSLMLTKLTLTYNNKEGTIIYRELADNILLSDFTLVNDKADEIRSAKIMYNIPLSFDEQAEVDKYENGEVDLSDYTSQQAYIMQIEINRRKEPFLKSELKTRYKYYREKEVREYTEFILNNYDTQLYLSVILSGLPYDIDNQYIELYNLNEYEDIVNAGKLFRSKLTEIDLNTDLVLKAADKLTDITFNIRNIRELFKTYCLKVFMYGTPALIKYIIHEYLKSNIVEILNTSNNIDSSYEYKVSNNDITFTEYNDTTNYSNLSCDTDKTNFKNTYLSSELSTLNPSFLYKVNTVRSIGAILNTDLFGELPYVNSQNLAFNINSLSDFYINLLHNKFFEENNAQNSQVQHLSNFLDKVYELGKENTFISDDNFHTYDSLNARNEYNNLIAFYNDISAKVGINKSSFNGIIDLLSSEYITKIINVVRSAKALSGLHADDSLLQLFQYISSLNDYSINKDSIKERYNIALRAVTYFNELNTIVPLSGFANYIKIKRNRSINSKKDVLNEVKETDSYVLQAKYASLLNKCVYYYNRIADQYDRISAYIPADFESYGIVLSNQLSNLNAIFNDKSRLSTLFKYSGQLKNNAILALNNLSTYIGKVDKLSAEIELLTFLETLSTEYDEQLGRIQTDIDVLRNSDTFKRRELLFFKYSNNISSDTPYYYMLNRFHPSYMLHPYMDNFFEKDEFSYGIENTNNITVNDVKNEITESTLSNYVDSSGYLVSAWNNPLKTNSNYQTRYELDTHLDLNGSINEQISYDGLYYPKAMYDFINNQKYELPLQYLPVNTSTSETSEDFDYRYNFIDSLSGVLVYDVNTNITSYLTFNPWYSHLNLTHAEYQHIAEQLLFFKGDLAAIARGDINEDALETYLDVDLFNYDIDAYGNSYILIKPYTAGKDYLEQKDAYGQLWFRIKNHPIAFPAYAYKTLTPVIQTDDFKHELTTMLSVSLMSLLDESISEIHVVKRARVPSTLTGTIPRYYTPLILNFALSKEKNTIIINGELDIMANSLVQSKVSYPIVAKLSQKTDSKTNKNIYYHSMLTLNDEEVFALASKARLSAELSSWNFETYYSDNNKFGVVYSGIQHIPGQYEKSKDTLILAKMYYDKTGSTTQYINPHLISDNYYYCIVDETEGTNCGYRLTQDTMIDTKKQYYEKLILSVNFESVSSDLVDENFHVNGLYKYDNDCIKPTANDANDDYIYGDKTYFKLYHSNGDEQHNGDIFTVAKNVWYLYDSTNKQYTIDRTKYNNNDNDNRSKFKDTRYIIKYKLVEIKDFRENPLKNKWYERFKYTQTNDTGIVIGKEYFKETKKNNVVTGYEKVDLNPIKFGWYEKIPNRTNISVMMSYLDFESRYDTLIDSLHYLPVVEVASIENTPDDTTKKEYFIENVCLDTYENYIDVAYLDLKVANTLSSYTNAEVNLTNLLNFESFNNSIKDVITIKTYKINNNLLELFKDKSYIECTDIGCYGLVGKTTNNYENELSNANNLGNTYLYKNILNNNAYKFLINAEPGTWCQFQLIDSKEFNKLSVAWDYYNKHDKRIQLSLVLSTWYDDNNNKQQLSVRTFGDLNKNLLWELFEVPVYDNNGTLRIGKLLIKNISDTKPKFYLSSYYDENLRYVEFVDESSTNRKLLYYITEKGTIATNDISSFQTENMEFVK